MCVCRHTLICSICIIVSPENISLAATFVRYIVFSYAEFFSAKNFLLNVHVQSAMSSSSDRKSILVCALLQVVCFKSTTVQLCSVLMSVCVCQLGLKCFLQCFLVLYSLYGI